MKKTIAIIGGGPAAMSLACFLDTTKYDVTIYEKNKALGRKFLVAGKGGFNLTHSSSQEVFLKQYEPAGFLEAAFAAFDNQHLVKWLDKIGLPTYVGSSGRIFPTKGIKPIQVLEIITNEIERNGATVITDFEWKDNMQADIVVYAMGGASWSVTGSDGKWSKYFATSVPFVPANCGYEVKWPDKFINTNEGNPLKNISIKIGDDISVGEVIVSKFGLEGNAIYALSTPIQAALNNGSATINIDLKSHLTLEKVIQKLQFSKEKTMTNSLKRDVKLDKTSIHLLQNFLTKDEYLNPELLADKIKSFPVELHSAAPIDEAISTFGGIPIDALDEDFQLLERPGHYCIGEMVDWYAPTGGYLLQACFSMGHHLAMALNRNIDD